jgi:hypothetical protein
MGQYVSGCEKLKLDAETALDGCGRSCPLMLNAKTDGFPGCGSMREWL